MNVNPVIIRRLYGLLTERSRLVMRSSSTLEMSSEVRTTTGAPQGCVQGCSLNCSYCARRTAGVLPEVHFMLSPRKTSL